MSARRPIEREPLPTFKLATTPVLPTPVVTLSPAAVKASATFLAVATSL